jgi:hypothetical protein
LGHPTIISHLHSHFQRQTAPWREFDYVRFFHFRESEEFGFCVREFLGSGERLGQPAAKSKGVRIPPENDHRIRSMPITQNAACRSAHTVDADQRKRSHADQFSAFERNR